MTVFSARFVLRAALIGALALGVAACGRKGPLDPPPSASVDGANASAQQQPAQGPNPLTMSPLGGGGSGSQGGGDMIEAPRGEKKRIFLDNLLN